MPTTASSPALAEPTQVCSICEEELPLTDDNFYRPPNSAAYEAWCRPCGRPRNGRGRKFGVEIEFTGACREDVARAMRSRGLRIREDCYYTHEVMPQWKIVTDGSLSEGYELVSPPLKGATGLRQVEKACAALTAAGASVNSQCGLHVHHDVSDLNTRQFGRLFRAWQHNQQAMNGLLAPSRRQSNWARPLTDDDLAVCERLESMVDDASVQRLQYLDRYRSLNAQCFPRYGTVEMRQHQGTLNAEKIIAWISFGRAMISQAKTRQPITCAIDATALVANLAADKSLPAAQARFLTARAAAFAARDGVVAPPADDRADCNCVECRRIREDRRVAAGARS